MEQYSIWKVLFVLFLGKPGEKSVAVAGGSIFDDGRFPFAGASYGKRGAFGSSGADEKISGGVTAFWGFVKRDKAAKRQTLLAQSRITPPQRVALF